MSKREKLLRRIESKPKDFTWDELVALMAALGIPPVYGAGSARKFRSPSGNAPLNMHQPHPSSTLKPYQVRDAILFLREEGFIK